MTRWEYTRHFIAQDCEVSALATYGAEGWELCAIGVQVDQTASGGQVWHLFYFKRALP